MHKEIKMIAFYFKENIQLVILVTVNMKNSNSASVIVWSEQLINNHPDTPTLRGGSPTLLSSLFSFLAFLIQ